MEYPQVTWQVCLPLTWESGGWELWPPLVADAGSLLGAAHWAVVTHGRRGFVISPLCSSTEACLFVLLNPELSVVDTGLL